MRRGEAAEFGDQFRVLFGNVELLRRIVLQVVEQWRIVRDFRVVAKFRAGEEMRFELAVPQGVELRAAMWSPKPPVRSIKSACRFCA